MALHIPAGLGVWFIASKVLVLGYMQKHFGERSRIAEMNREEALDYIDASIAEWERTDGTKALLRTPMLARLYSIRAEVADAEGVHPRVILNTRLDRMYREVRGAAHRSGLVAGALGATVARIFGDTAR